jgi:ATP-binding cassette, subfamily C, bacterial CydC
MKEIQRLLSFLKPFYKEVSLSVLIGVATIGAGIGMMGTSAFLISTAALHPSIAELQVAIVGVRFFGISRGVFRYLERLVSHSVNLKVVTRLRVWFYENAERIAPAGLQSERGGELLNRVMADLEALENFYVRVVSPILVAFIITLGMSFFIGGYFIPLGLILVGGMITNGVILPALSIFLTQHSGSQLQKARAVLSADLLETFQGLEDLQSAGAEQRWQQKIEDESRKVGKLQLFYGFLTGLNDAFTLLVLNLTLLIILITAIPQVTNGQMSGVSLAVVSLLTIASFEATNSLPQAAQNLTASVASAKRLFGLAVHNIHEDAQKLIFTDQMIQSAQKVEIEELDFAYTALDGKVLDKINLTLKRGKITALIGPNGAGKSSLVNVLLRFWDFSGGKILVDGKDIRSFNDESVQKLFTVISQNNYLFAMTLRENLLLARPGASDEDLKEALRNAELSDWFAGLPEGLDAWLGEQGAQMSGGEAQRLAIARAILQDAPFVLLDEPTSHLDPVTERKLLTTLFRVFNHKGMLLITHQLVMLDKANEIAFIEAGRILEQGTQTELLTKNGKFKHYWKLQQDNIPEYWR